MAYKETSDWTRCKACGECLSRCPVLGLDKAEAAEEMRRLVDGRHAGRVMSRCTLCFDCNDYCPEGLRPHDLILHRVMEARPDRITAAIPYFLNGTCTPNFFSDLYEALSPGEKEVLDRWEQPPDGAAEVLWVGCVGRLSCADIDASDVLAPLAKYGPRDGCCGELHYRVGSWKAYEKQAADVYERLASLDCERLVCYCGSCYNFLTNVMPRATGRTLPFDVVSMYQWMADRLDRGEIRLSRPLEGTAAVHESCYVSELGEGFSNLLNNLYEAAGLECRNLGHNGCDGLSCGAASLARDTNPAKSLLPAQWKKYREIWASGTRDVALNCPGCFLTLGATAPLAGVRLRYMPEELLYAFGDEQNKPLSTRRMLIYRTLARRAAGFLRKVPAHIVD
ncbi:MAG: heterodisulfide reductase-related iron-sulfur binding cluster [Desulfatibacillaceae bacterium]